jgi:membrane associated rhomboid family serine protease
LQRQRDAPDIEMVTLASCGRLPPRVHPQLFDHLLLLAAVLCAVTLVRLVRRSDGAERGYALLIGALLVTSVIALGQSPFFGALALAGTGLTVILPWLLEHGSRWAFARGRLSLTARLGIARAMLMPGAGLHRQIPILEGIGLVERRGVDAALAHFRRLADQAEDAVELAMIHEQIVAMLFHGQRWDEGIAHYERRFHPGYAALRPSLALGLLRAYGESGRLDTAAGLLRALEDGPVGADPNTSELIGQARLTFLAYAGAVEPVDELVARQRFGDLGLSPATAELFKGIAQARAGAPREAAETLRKVEQLAGPRDHRVLQAARDALAEVGRRLRGEPVRPESSERAGEPASPSVELEPELGRYVELVGQRLREFIAAPPTLRRQERTWVTQGVIMISAMIYGVHLLRGGGSVGLLELGALVEDLWRAGSWGRVFTSAWIHVDLVGLLFDAYALWLAGQLIERLLGPVRMGLVTIGAAIAGMAASVISLPWVWELGLAPLARVGATGGNLMAVGASTAALWLLLPSRTPMIGSRVRRNLVVTLALLLATNLITNWPGALGFGMSPIALLTSVTVASVIALLPKRSSGLLGRVRETAAKLTLGGLLLASAVAGVLVLGEDPQREAIDHRRWTCEVAGVELHTPMWFVEQSLDRDVPFELPVVDGLLDTLELRDGSLVQLAVVRDGGPSEVDGEVRPKLGDDALAGLGVTAAGSLPEPFAAKLADEGRHWRAFDLWRNGERVGRMIERELPEVGQAPATVVLLATPASALEHAPELWVAILADASPVGEPDRRTVCRVD